MRKMQEIVDKMNEVDQQLFDLAQYMNQQLNDKDLWTDNDEAQHVMHTAYSRLCLACNFTYQSVEN